MICRDPSADRLDVAGSRGASDLAHLAGSSGQYAGPLASLETQRARLSALDAGCATIPAALDPLQAILVLRVEVVTRLEELGKDLEAMPSVAAAKLNQIVARVGEFARDVTTIARLREASDLVVAARALIAALSADDGFRVSLTDALNQSLETAKNVDALLGGQTQAAAVKAALTQTRAYADGLERRLAALLLETVALEPAAAAALSRAAAKGLIAVAGPLRTYHRKLAQAFEQLGRLLDKPAIRPVVAFILGEARLSELHAHIANISTDDETLAAVVGAGESPDVFKHAATLRDRWSGTPSLLTAISMVADLIEDFVAGTNDTFHADRPSTLTSKELESAQSRGSVLVMDRAALARQQRLYGALELPQPRYYPDRYARQMIVALSSVPHFSSPQITTGGPRIAQFWKPAQTPRDATPIMLELARGAEDPGKPAGIQIGSTSMQLPDGATVAVPKVTVSLQPGEVMDLELFANPAAKEFRANHHGAALIKDPGDYRPSSAWSTARKELCHVRTVRLVHAVKRPVRPPAFGIAAGKIDLRAVTRTVRPEGTPGDIPQWSDIANSGKPIVSEEGGGTTFFIGAATIHGRSTCELRCEARWKDYGIDSIKRDPATGRWVADTPVQYDQLFHIKGIASAKASLPVNLLRDDGELRALSHAFRDGRARCLQVRLVATSRFTDYFPPDPDADDRVDTIGAFERASNDFNPAQAIWTDCIFRPPPPVVDRILPIFDWTRGKDGNRLTFARQSRLRLFLDRRWFASGEGEQLALVFDQAKRKLCDYEDDKLIPYAQYLTRWGRDPIRLTRHVELVRPGDIVGNEIGELFLHAETGTDTGKRPAPHPVTIIAFTPELDPVLGLYCDIRLANPQGALFSYMPFIQLGLARYQEHAVEALKLSHPVQCMVQILPDRAGYVQISGPTSVKVVVSGPAFGSMEDEYHRMRLNVRLMERIPLPGGGEGSWRPARGGDNRDVVMLDQRPNGAIDDELWSIELTLPASHMGTHYGLLIEEYEMLPADPVEQVENAPRGADPLEGTQLFQRGPLFQTTVDLRQPNDPYEGA